jgi:periplasmic protein TonB
VTRLLLAPLVMAGTALLLAASPPVPNKMLISEADYPEAARNAGVEGDVAFDVLIDEKGKVTGCEITAGGDLPGRLAADSCTVAQTRWRFAPARDDAGKKVPGRVHYAIAWRISRRCPPPDRQTICVFL